MKNLCVALALVLSGSAVGAAAAHAVTPKKGNWKITNASTVTKNDSKGFMQVYKKGKRLYMKQWTSPSLYVKCVGAKAGPEEMNPGFEYLGSGTNKVHKLSGKSRRFKQTYKIEGPGGVVVTYSGKFTSAKKASGTVRVRFTKDPERQCDSGALRWTASK